jgi:7,8-dihydropterin-6-yl-methyl-4-(beta-D-ribofuranosyl)aminobenzene 5'-phosphate synthase
MNTRNLISRIILVPAGLVFVISVFAFIQKPLAAERNPITITILYDNDVARQGTEPGWGFSCLVEAPEETILFDTGSQCTKLFRNMNELGVNPQDVDQVVISQEHSTPAGGLCPFLEKNHKVTVYVPASFSGHRVREVEYAGAGVQRVDAPVEICEDAFLTGEMGARTKEQSLILNTPQGLVVITGCAHPGIVSILERARQILPNRIYLVLGGFHLLGKSKEDMDKIMAGFRRLGVMRVAPTACTGHRNMELFREEFGDGFVRVGVGRTLKIQ